MIPSTYIVRPVPVQFVKSFIEEHHYSHSINGCKVALAFSLEASEEGKLVGAALFGGLSTTAWKKYADKESEVIELRRLVCLDECPRNTESWLISRCLKYLKRNLEYKICVSYADPYHSHTGIIYQAANWSYLGVTSEDTLLKTPEGKLYHSRALRTKYKGRLKPFAERLGKLKKQGLLQSIKVPGKHIYTYTLVGVHKRIGLPYPKVNY